MNVPLNVAERRYRMKKSLFLEKFVRLIDRYGALDLDTFGRAGEIARDEKVLQIFYSQLAKILREESMLVDEPDSAIVATHPIVAALSKLCDRIAESRIKYFIPLDCLIDIERAWEHYCEQTVDSQTHNLTVSLESQRKTEKTDDGEAPTILS